MYFARVRIIDIRSEIFYLCGDERVDQSVSIYLKIGVASSSNHVCIFLINMFAEVSVWTDMVVCK